MIATRLDAPIVLTHGLFGFDRIGLGSFTILDYFRGIPRALREAGNRVLVTRVHPIAGMNQRAAQLAQQIEAVYPDGPFHLIGHSMGGLDSRFLLTDPDWRDRVLSLTTIGTPHLGTALADVLSGRAGPISRGLSWLGLDHEGVLQISRTRARAFHRQAPPPRGVTCLSLAGNPLPEETCLAMRPFQALLSLREGPNDGLVPAHSALAFGEPLGPWPIDHLRQMNWFPAGDSLPSPLGLYDAALDRLAQLGYGEPAEVAPVTELVGSRQYASGLS